MEVNLQKDITFTNKRRIEINKVMMRRKAKTNKYLQLDKSIFDDNSQDVRLTIHQLLLAKIIKNLIYSITNSLLLNISNLKNKILLLFLILMMNY